MASSRSLREPPPRHPLRQPRQVQAATGAPLVPGHPLHWVLAAVTYLALSLSLCWPLAAELTSHLPLGELSDLTVPLFNLWTLAWNADRLAHGFAGYWDAPIFYPAHDTFALSEPEGLTGLWFAPLQALVGPVAAYNLTLLSMLVANGLAGRRLLIVLGSKPLRATWLGVLFVVLPFVREELGVLQLCAAWPMLLGFGELALLTHRRDPWAVVRLGLWTVATAWTCIYYLLFFALMLALALPMLWLQHWRHRPTWLAGFVALGITAAAITPLAAAERRVVSQHTRSAASIRLGSGSALAYLQFPKDTPPAKLMPRWTRPAGRRSLYPGALVCALAAVGIALDARRNRRWLVYSLAAATLALLLSFGTRLHFGGLSPYTLTAQRYLPGFGQLRSPYRAALLVHLLLTAWAGRGLDTLADRLLSQGRARAARACLALGVSLAVFEVTPWHFHRARFPNEALQAPWIAWLRDAPKGPVAMLPPNASGRAADYVETVVYMLQALEHGHPIVNGYSGFFPPASERMVSVLRTFPSERSLSALRSSQIRYAVVDRTLPAVEQLEQHPRPALERVFDTGPRVIYRIH